jgi:hypothetical protein
MHDLKPDLEQAGRFLAALDPSGGFTFQTFCDRKTADQNTKKQLARIFHGDFDEHGRLLTAFQRDGAGIFVTVNKTDLKGRTKDNVTGVRALFVDLDGAPIEPVRDFSLKPTIVVESSPGRWHAYWRITDLPLTGFTAFQQALIRRFNGDVSVHDLPRVMRLPGFWHQKNEPVLSRIEELDATRAYSRADFVEALGADPLGSESTRSSSTSEGGPDPSTEPNGDTSAAVRARAMQIIAAAAAKTHAKPTIGRRKLLLRLGFELQCASIPKEIAAELMRMSARRLFRETDSDGQHAPLDPGESARAIENAYQPDKEVRPPRAGPWSRPEIDLDEWTLVRFEGKPEDREMLVGGLIPLRGLASLVGMGGAGKGILVLDLALRVAGADPGFGGEDWLGAHVSAKGTAVVILAEDDRQEVHRRLEALRKHLSPPILERLIIIPLPDAGGPLTLFQGDWNGPEATPHLESLEAQLRAIPDLKLVVIDPLQAFVALDLNSDAMAAQFLCGRLAQLAADTGAAIILTHHMRKGSKEIENPADAREAVRGSTAIVDGCRTVIAVWNPPVADARKSCAALSVEWEPHAYMIMQCAVVKANWPADFRPRTLLRSSDGLLVDRTEKLRAARPDNGKLSDALVVAVAEAAREGHPFTKTGQNGLYKRRHELPEEFRAVGRNRLEELAQELLEKKTLTANKVEKAGNSFHWLDVPGGPVDEGTAVIVPRSGASDRKKGKAPRSKEGT